ncbi:hypothetical protein PPTG_22564 [Phytophthora nicotianae INRA-310]|uniref:Uncharacterized protein n=1 Tax=Phytophthora nicotianae (strain INRA-310) TaxID=761204 RepID=W2QIH2_PHYN3|nr:hypothetical protein PPTG_22564 [Phytophthora nicotianae INRA-310]ETN12065.1 hypothetical protein PPTG_22564 [Phytophthora nicotianae INRA-310]
MAKKSASTDLQTKICFTSMSDCPMGNAFVRTLDVFKAKFAKEFKKAAWLDKILSLHKTVPHKSS